MKVEELTFDPDSRQAADTLISLGKPRRAWMFAEPLERARPPQPFAAARPGGDRCAGSVRLVRLAAESAHRSRDRSERAAARRAGQQRHERLGHAAFGRQRPCANWRVDAASPEALVDSVFLRFLTRLPTPAERARFAAGPHARFRRTAASSGRARAGAAAAAVEVSWSNHLMTEATEIKMEMERRARAGDPPDPRLAPAGARRMKTSSGA